MSTSTTTMAESKELPVDYGKINEQNIEQLRKLNLSCFPVVYHQKFYQNVIQTPSEVTEYAYFNGFVVGAISCRVEPPSGEGPKKLYIMTLAVLAPYRRRGIAKNLIQRVMKQVETNSKFVDVTEIYLHVQISNEDAMGFYHSLGFETGEMIENYYRRIEPPHCYILRKAVEREPAAEDSATK